MNTCEAGVRIGDALFSSMAYADDTTLFSTNVQYLQNIFDIIDYVLDKAIRGDLNLVSKRSNNTALFKALNIEKKIEYIVNRNVLSLYNM